ncbi:hypothetical protein DFJ58DRAFT_860790 [Suillus subalutaceus]|uniref:uncharacterized protein n=1 Tax=Suillus subalutaceus TaxID=48586 RepID=UPI001B8868D2|nr:uncharacterized protein DFJ58DRAFT_860790 [Suillus subalutaceus]KAG1838798.1 hypothetical protein DFJ58DRAFT_860790 [Suillus subalutaceus]
MEIASIRGSLLVQWRAIANEQRGDDGIDDAEEAEGSCARPSNIQRPEVYMSNMGGTSTRAHTYPMRLETDRRADQTRRWLLDGGLAVLENLPSLPSQEEGAAEEEEWEREATSTLETQGWRTDHAFRVSQLAIILDRTSSLLETFAAGLRDGRFDPESSDSAARDSSHSRGLPTSFGSQLAMYVGALGDDAVERYEMFLTSLELTADINERRLALTRAREHHDGVNVHRVAAVTAE